MRLLKCGRVWLFHLLPCSVLLIAAVPALCDASDLTIQPRRNWTVIQYVAGDNKGARAFGKTLSPLRTGTSRPEGLNWVLLVDLAKGYADYTDVFGENFSGTRIYEARNGRFVRRSGGDVMPQITMTSTAEMNTADAKTLRDFIRFAKKYYPANHYALIVLSHGSGPYFAPDDNPSHMGDVMYTAEVTDVLTKEESVDLTILDLCMMASLENFYQWRPGNGRFSTSLVVASAPSSGSPDYGELINRVTDGKMKVAVPDPVIGGNKKSYRPKYLTPEDFAEVVLSDLAEVAADQSWGVFDLHKAAALKRAFDHLAVAVSGDAQARTALENLRGRGTRLVTMQYLRGVLDHAGEDTSWLQGEDGLWDWLYCPCFDVYDFGSRVATSPDLSASARAAGEEVRRLAGEMTLYSFGSRKHWANFEAGKNGMYFIFPDGDLRLHGMREWDLMRWYSGSDLRSTLLAYERAVVAGDQTKPASGGMELMKFRNMAYGRLSWALDDARPAGNGIGNWYQLMEAWYGKRD